VIVLHFVCQPTLQSFYSKAYALQCAQISIANACGELINITLSRKWGHRRLNDLREEVRDDGEHG
jgi:hypothetical protein